MLNVSVNEFEKKKRGQDIRSLPDSNRRSKKNRQKNGSFSLIERVILSAGAMLIFSVSFQIDQMSEDTTMVFRKSI